MLSLEVLHVEIAQKLKNLEIADTLTLTVLLTLSVYSTYMFIRYTRVDKKMKNLILLFKNPNSYYHTLLSKRKLNKYCLMKQNCQFQIDIAQYQNTATPLRASEALIQ